MLTSVALSSVLQPKLEALRAGLDPDGSRPHRTGLLLKASLSTDFPLAAAGGALVLPLELTLWRSSVEDATLFLGSPCHGLKFDVLSLEETVPCSSCGKRWPTPRASLAAALEKRLKTPAERGGGLLGQAEQIVEEWLTSFSSLPVLALPVEAGATVAQVVRLLQALPQRLPPHRSLRFVPSRDELVYPPRKVLDSEGLVALEHALALALEDSL